MCAARRTWKRGKEGESEPNVRAEDGGKESVLTRLTKQNLLIYWSGFFKLRRQRSNHYSHAGSRTSGVSERLLWLFSDLWNSFTPSNGPAYLAALFIALNYFINAIHYAYKIEWGYFDVRIVEGISRANIEEPQSSRTNLWSRCVVLSAEWAQQLATCDYLSQYNTIYYIVSIHHRLRTEHLLTARGLATKVSNFVY